MTIMNKDSADVTVAILEARVSYTLLYIVGSRGTRGNTELSLSEQNHS